MAINRRDLLSIPVPSANLLWRDLHTRNVKRTDGKQETQNIRIDIAVEGETNNKPWTCGLEFDFANDESLFCRPLRTADGKNPSRMPVPDETYGTKLAYLPPCRAWRPTRRC